MGPKGLKPPFKMSSVYGCSPSSYGHCGGYWVNLSSLGDPRATEYVFLLNLPIKVEIAEVLHRVHRVRLEEMAILTPYSAQKDEIKKLALQVNLLREGPGPTPDGIKVASITESQGMTSA